MTTKKPKTARKRSSKLTKSLSHKDSQAVIAAMNVITGRNGLARECDHELAEAAQLMLILYTRSFKNLSAISTKLDRLSKEIAAIRL